MKKRFLLSTLFCMCITISQFAIATNIKKPVVDTHSALYAHINFFSDPTTGDITADSIKHKLIEMHVPDKLAQMQATMIANFNQDKFTKTTGCPFAMNPAKYGVEALYHAGTTRINKKDGTLNLVRLEQLKKAYSQNYQGKRIVTLASVYQYLEDLQKQDEGDVTDSRPDPTGAEKKANQGAWYGFFAFFTSGWIEIPGKPGEYEGYVTVEQIDQFYKDPAAAWMTVINKEVPVPKPKVK